MIFRLRSLFHGWFTSKRLLLGTAVWVVCLMGIHSDALAVNGTLSFESSPSPNVEGYRVHYGTQSRSYDDTVDVGSSTRCRITGLDPGSLYYFAVTAYDGFGNESEYSTELVVNTPSNDSDGDGLTNDEEQDVYGTDPDSADTDNDGLSDQEELTYWGDAWNGDPDGDGLINLLDYDADQDGLLDGQDPKPGSRPKDQWQTSFAFEVFELNVETAWRRVSFSEPFQDPVIVAKAVDTGINDPFVVQIRNVTSEGFEVRIQEWSCLDGAHAPECVSCVVMESGHYELPNGAEVEAGTFRTDGSAHVSFLQRFGGRKPVVVASAMSLYGSEPVAGRLSAVDADGFSCRLQEQESSDQVHVQEIVAYIAWEPSVGEVNGVSYEVARTGEIVTHRKETFFCRQPFVFAPACLIGMQTMNGWNTATARAVNRQASSIELAIAEETSMDEETAHTSEDVGCILLGFKDPYADSDQDGLSNGQETETTGTNPLNPDTDGDGLEELEEILVWKQEWNRDGDADGLINLLDPDADGDGFTDGCEVSKKTDPADPRDHPGS